MIVTINSIKMSFKKEIKLLTLYVDNLTVYFQNILFIFKVQHRS